MLEGRLRCINSRRRSRSELNIASARRVIHTLFKDNSPKSKIISILTRLINKCLHFKMFSSGLILGGHECLCATSQKRHLTRVNLFTVSYCLFANGDVSIRFIGKVKMHNTTRSALQHPELIMIIHRKLKFGRK